MVMLTAESDHNGAVKAMAMTVMTWHLVVFRRCPEWAVYTSYSILRTEKRARLADAAVITPLKIILIKVNIHTHSHSHGQRKQGNRYLLRLFRDPVFPFPLSPFCQLTDGAKIILRMRSVACTNCLRKDSSFGESYIWAIDRISIRRRT